MKVHIVPCLRDNYAYVVHAEGDRSAFIVDPSEAEPVLEVLEREGLELVAVLNTHHHYDHVGGNESLAARFPGLPIIAFEGDRGRVPGQTRGVRDGERFTVAGLSISVHHIPGHTTGAIGYSLEGAVFTGDTMFSAGCGRLFEGTAADMHRSLNEVLAALPDETLVYSGHEYTLSNLKFARHVDPTNSEVERALGEAEARRAKGQPTIPTRMAQERAVNPFLRVTSSEIAERFGGGSAVDVLRALRAAKDTFQS